MTSKEAAKERLTENNINDLSVSEQRQVESFKDCQDKRKTKFEGRLYVQLGNSCDSKMELAESFDSTLTFMEDIKPRDCIEKMLATQMIATHHATMDCYKMLVKNKNLKIMDLMLRSAGKLSRTFTMQMEALNRYRGKGGQKMTVEHVHINSGGQAIIGNVTKNVTDREGGEEEKLKYE
jgi:hypothetical protein